MSPDFNAEAFYYLGSFYFQASYQLMNRYLDSYMNYIYKSRDYYSLMAGWANSMWNVRLSASNFLSRGHLMSETEYHSQNYVSRKTNYGTTYCPRINLSESYTIGYGKKIMRDNEVGERAGAASAIIK